jgi:outer membrane protein assembly factor BamB
MKFVTTICLLLFFTCSFSQTKPFRFAFVSDTHIGSPDGKAEEDLRRTVTDINSIKDSIAFVVITGDITELGTNQQLLLAKQILDSLQIPYYIIPGNHDTGWSESGGLGFTNTFGSDKFQFKYNGINFIGCASGPYVRMSDGHVPRDAVNWLNKKFKSIKKNEPLIFLNHYPLDNGLDNWYEVIDLLKTKNTILALCGHGHTNRSVKAEDIPSVMGRSNLRAKQAEGGYNLVDVRKDSIVFFERKPVSKAKREWIAVKNENHQYDLSKKFSRPDFSINQKYSNVKPAWTYQSSANVISTPAVVGNDEVVFGNQSGTVESLDLSTGKRKWSFNTNGPVFSSPAQMGEDIAVGSADGFVYCLTASGKLRWKFKTGASVLGSPLIENHVVYIGGSDHHFRAIDIGTGHLIFEFDSLQGPVVSKPVIYNNVVLFGAWDKNLYAFDLNKRKLRWKWSNGSSVINYSPAACIPVVKDNVVYIVAPDRYLSAIDIESGKTLWRTNEATVRESIGISNDGKLIYGKTMQDTVVAFYTNKDKPELAWKMNVGYGYEHSPSMLIEKNGKVYFGTRNGVVYCIDPATQKIVWAYKIDNSMVNTVNVLNNSQVIASTMDGKVCLLQEQ